MKWMHPLFAISRKSLTKSVKYVMINRVVLHIIKSFDYSWLRTDMNYVKLMFKAFYRYSDGFVNRRKNWIAIEMHFNGKCDALAICLMVKNSYNSTQLLLQLYSTFCYLWKENILKYSHVIQVIITYIRLLCVIFKHKYQYMNRHMEYSQNGIFS